MYILKKKWRASFGRFICILGLNSSLSSPTSEQVCKKGGGGDSSIAPGNRLLATDHGLTGFPDLRSTQAWVYRSPDEVSLDRRLKFAITCEFT